MKQNIIVFVIILSVGYAAADIHFLASTTLLQSSRGRMLRKRNSSSDRAIKKVKRSATVCESFPEEKALCFGNEDGENGLATCDAKSLYFSVEACCARTIGLSSCLGSDTIDKCGLRSAFIALEGVGCANDINEGPNGTVISQLYVPDQVMETQKLLRESLSDESLESYMVESNMTKWEVKASVNAVNVKLLENEKVLFGVSNHTSGGGHRQLGYSAVVTGVVTLIKTALNLVLTFIVNPIQDEGRQREAFTKEAAARCFSSNPDYSCIVIASWIRHTISGSNYIRVSQTFTGWAGRTYTYYVYAVQNTKSFRLQNLGDGGYINWAIHGYFNRNGNTVDMQIWSRGARVFEHENGQGWVRYLPSTSNYYNEGTSFLNDAISSIEVDEGCVANGYEAHHLQGNWLWMVVGFYNVHNCQWGDRISSMTVRC